MPVILTAAFQVGPDDRFDIDYLVKEHYRIVREKWTSKGLKSVRAVKVLGTPSPDMAPLFDVISILEFEDMDGLLAAEADNAEVRADVANFTDLEPRIQFGEVME